MVKIKIKKNACEQYKLFFIKYKNFTFNHTLVKWIFVKVKLQKKSTF